MELAAFPPLLFATPLLLFRSLSSRFASFSLIFGQRVSRYTRNNVFHSFSRATLPTTRIQLCTETRPIQNQLASLFLSLFLSRGSPFFIGANTRRHTNLRREGKNVWKNGRDPIKQVRDISRKLETYFTWFTNREGGRQIRQPRDSLPLVKAYVTIQRQRINSSLEPL